jgi:hypothetical protein
MDASNFAISVILSQLRKNNPFHLVSSYSYKFSLMEINYEIHDKELLTILDAFENWCHLVEEAQHKIIMYLDHKNLQYFTTACVLNRLFA